MPSTGLSTTRARAGGDKSAPPLPLVINISLGTNGHAHDGSSPISHWIDAALNVPGRCVVAAAGNAGQDAARSRSDVGWMSGRIHSEGRIAASGLEADIEWRVMGNGLVDLSENEMEIWYEPEDRFVVELRPPKGKWIGPVSPGRYYRDLEQKDGTFVSIFNERYHPANGANRISLYLSPRLGECVVGVRAGTWTIRLRGDQVRNGRYHAWIERDDPRRLGRIGKREAWRFPSFFSKRSYIDKASVSSLACGQRVVSVSNYEEAAERIHPSSSQGPTRDGRSKPEIAAPGTNIVAARGFAPSHEPWVSKTGTSMASPYVAGVIALMLGVERRLTAAQIIGILRRTAQPLPGDEYNWQDDAGFGRIRPAKCLDEAARVFEEQDLDQ